MWYSKENKVGTYTLGYAISKNGINWKRKDNLVGIFKSKIADSEMITYPNVIYHNKKYFMFYNGKWLWKIWFWYCYIKRIVKMVIAIIQPTFLPYWVTCH